MAGTSGVRWLIDPIDGTTNFLYGLPGWGVSIAAADDDGPSPGAVAIPSLGELFSAAHGQGARRDGVPLRCSDKADLETALVGTGFSYQPGRRAEQGMVMTALLPRVRDVRRFGSAAADLCFVAARGSTSTTRPASPRGTWRPARSSPARPVPPSPTSTAARCGPVRSSPARPRCTSRSSSCSARWGRRTEPTQARVPRNGS